MPMETQKPTRPRGEGEKDVVIITATGSTTRRRWPGRRKLRPTAPLSSASARTDPPGRLDAERRLTGGVRRLDVQPVHRPDGCLLDRRPEYIPATGMVRHQHNPAHDQLRSPSRLGPKRRCLWQWTIFFANAARANGGRMKRGHVPYFLMGGNQVLGRCVQPGSSGAFADTQSGPLLSDGGGQNRAAKHQQGRARGDFTKFGFTVRFHRPGKRIHLHQTFVQDPPSFEACSWRPRRLPAASPRSAATS